MFRYTLLLVAATVFGSLADRGYFRGRRQGYNTNANNNALYGGYVNGMGPDHGSGSGHGRLPPMNSPKYENRLGAEIANGRDHGRFSPKYDNRLETGSGRERVGTLGGSNNYDNLLGINGVGSGKGRTKIYVRPSKYQTVVGAEIIESGRDRPKFLGPMKYTTDRTGSSSGYLEADGDVDPGASYDRVCDSIFRIREIDDDERPASEEPEDGDGIAQEMYNYNNNYNVVFKDSSRRYLGYPQNYNGAGIRGGRNTNSNANTNSMSPRNRRNWHQYELDNADKYEEYPNDEYEDISNVIDPGFYQQPEPKKKTKLYDESEDDYDRVRQDYGRIHRGSNVNTNANYNVFGGRRSNVNSNANTNEIRGGRYDSDDDYRRTTDKTVPRSAWNRGTDRTVLRSAWNSPTDKTVSRSGWDSDPSDFGYDRRPSYPGYYKDVTGTERDRGASNRPGRYPSMNGFNPKDLDAYNDDDEPEDQDDIYSPSQYDNVNTNSNTNVNIISRRNANGNSYSRKKRSAANPLDASKSRDDMKKLGGSTSSKAGSSTMPKPDSEQM